MELNENQARAAYSEKPCLCKAGPGSGKTRTLVSRVEYLLKNKISPTEILCFTFTRSAGKELKDRLEKKFDIEGLSISTIHSFCLRVIRDNHHLINYQRNIIIYDDVDSKDLKSIIAREHKLKYNAERNSGKDKEIVNEEYDKKLKEYNAVNYESMEEIALRLLKSGKLEHIQKRYRFVLLDEMQDISQTDFELIKHLTKYHRNLFATGDLQQCIFQFRGSKPELIDELGSCMSEVNEVELNLSYRCSQNILDFCNVLSDTELVAASGEAGPMPQFQALETPTDEAEWIRMMIESYQCKNVGILCRTNKMIQFLSEEFDAAGLEHNVIGKTVRLLDQPPVRMVNAFMKFRYNHNNYLHFYKVMSILNKDLPESQIQVARSLAIIEKKSLLEKASEEFDLSVFKEDDVTFLDQVLQMLREWHHERGMTTKETMLDEYEEYVKGWLEENPGCDLNDYIFYMNDINVTEDSIQESEENRINLLTIHAAKGLEFESVFIPGMSSFNFRRNDTQPMFVAVSRAEKHLFLSYTHKFESGGTLKKSKPSYYIRDLGFHVET